jgi:hypothetical protein
VLAATGTACVAWAINNLFCFSLVRPGPAPLRCVGGVCRLQVGVPPVCSQAQWHEILPVAVPLPCRVLDDRL